jgi:hypothetical protein
MPIVSWFGGETKKKMNAGVPEKNRICAGKAFRWAFGHEANGAKPDGIQFGMSMDLLAWIFDDVQQHKSLEDCLSQHRVVSSLIGALVDRFGFTLSEHLI